MKLEPKQNNEEIEVDMSPMIDMVFLLLIFFIVASQIVDTKPKVEIPEAAYSKIPEDETGRLMISVNTNDQVFVRSRTDNPIPIDELDSLKELIQAELEANEKLRILIRSDGNVRYETNEKLMIACAEVGAQDLIFSAFEE